MSMQFQVPSALDYLFDEIRHPKASTSVDKVLSYLAYYYPKIKNAGNIELLTRCFLSCPLFANESVELTCKVANCFRWVLDSKYRISEPTLPFHTFYRALYEGISEDSPALCPMIMGCLLTVDSRAKYDPSPAYFGSIKEVDNRLLGMIERSLVGSFTPSSLLYLAVLQDNVSDKTFRSVLNHHQGIPVAAVDFLFYFPFGYAAPDSPAAVYLNKLSQAYAKMVQMRPNLEAVDASLSRIVASPVPVSKQILFALVAMFEGFAVQINTGLPKNAPLYCSFSTKILDCFFNLSVILEQTGTGGFDTYNFVYNTCFACLKTANPRGLESLARSWITSKDQPKLLFCLNFLEAVLDSLSPEMKFQTVLPLLTSLLNTAPSQDLLEAAHSAMLKYIEPTAACLDYLRLAISQFPSRLSMNQLTIIVDTLARAVLPDSPISTQFFDLLFREAVQSASFGIPNAAPFKHRRPALASLLVRISPLFPTQYYISRLHYIKTVLIDPTTDHAEKEALLDQLWNSILTANKYDAQKGTLGIDWWYKSKL